MVGSSVRSLHVYPVKGARGVSLDRAEVLATGIRHDRRFMVVGKDGKFVTQREHPRMALVEITIGGDALTLAAAGMSASVPLTPASADVPRRRVRVWNDEVEAIDVGGEGSAFFSEHLGEDCSLVFMPDDVVRAVEAPFGQPNDRVGFADGYPVLIAALPSLDDLNRRLTAAGAPPVPIDRFRPNIVVEGGEPFAEERAARAQVGAIPFRTPKRCARCQVVTVDQETAERGKEPLRTLATYRTEANKVNFAMNAIPDLAGVISIGDAVVYT
jgi:uncharacterized protein YcbX